MTLSINNFRARQALTTTGATSEETGTVAAAVGVHAGGGFQLGGTFVGTVQFEETFDGGDSWIAKLVYPAGGGPGVTSATAPGQWKFANGGSSHVRARCSAYTSGSIAVDILLTNGVDPIALLAAPAGQRRALLKGTFAYAATSYAAGEVVGGKVTVATGLPAGTPIRISRLFVFTTQPNVTTPQSLLTHIFDTDPAASTLADDTAQVVHANDIAKLVDVIVPLIGPGVGGSGAAGWKPVTSNLPIELAVDASGQFYFAVASAASSLVFNAAGSLNYRVEYSW